MNLPFPKPALPWAIVEIPAGTSAEDRYGLIVGAYRASRAGIVALALRGVSRASVDQVLDDVVDLRDRGPRGVLYLDGANEAELVAAASHAGVVIAWTAEFRTLLAAHGIRVLEAPDAGRFLSLGGAAPFAAADVAH